LGEFDFSGVEVSNSADLETFQMSAVALPKRRCVL
jgi:hypothetical protein